MSTKQNHVSQHTATNAVDVKNVISANEWPYKVLSINKPNSMPIQIKTIDEKQVSIITNILMNTFSIPRYETGLVGLLCADSSQSRNNTDEVRLWVRSELLSQDTSNKKQAIDELESRLRFILTSFSCLRGDF